MWDVYWYIIVLSTYFCCYSRFIEATVWIKFVQYIMWLLVFSSLCWILCCDYRYSSHFSLVLSRTINTICCLIVIFQILSRSTLNRYELNKHNGIIFHAGFQSCQLVPIMVVGMRVYPPVFNFRTHENTTIKVGRYVDWYLLQPILRRSGNGRHSVIAGMQNSNVSNKRDCVCFF